MKMKSCERYSPSHTYDMFVFQELENIFVHEIGCSVPFLTSAVPVCTDLKLIRKVHCLIIFDLKN